VSVWVGIGLAVIAALAINASYLMQHSGLAALPPVHARSLRALLSSRLWVLGAVVSYLGFIADVGALALAPLAVVQSIVTAGLVIVLAGARRAARTRPTLRECVVVGLTVLAVTMLSIGVTRQRAVPSPLGLAAFFGAAAMLGALLALGGTARGPASGRRLGAAAGVFYGCTDVALVALFAAHLRPSAVAAVAVAGGAAVTAGGFLAFQRGLQIGRPVAVVSMMSAATSVVAVAGGVLLLHEPLGSPPALAAVHLGAFAAVAVMAALATDEVSGAVLPESPRPASPPRSWPEAQGRAA